MEADCPICIDSVLIDASAECGHKFCYACILKWSEHENSCPLCKQTFSYLDVRKADGVERIQIKNRTQAEVHEHHNSLSRFVRVLVSSFPEQNALVDHFDHFMLQEILQFARIRRAPLLSSAVASTETPLVTYRSIDDIPTNEPDSPSSTSSLFDNSTPSPPQPSILSASTHSAASVGASNVSNSSSGISSSTSIQQRLESLRRRIVASRDALQSLASAAAFAQGRMHDGTDNDLDRGALAPRVGAIRRILPPLSELMNSTFPGSEVELYPLPIPSFIQESSGLGVSSAFSRLRSTIPNRASTINDELDTTSRSRARAESDVVSAPVIKRPRLE